MKVNNKIQFKCSTCIPSFAIIKTLLFVEAECIKSTHRTGRQDTQRTKLIKLIYSTIQRAPGIPLKKSLTNYIFLLSHFPWSLPTNMYREKFNPRNIRKIGKRKCLHWKNIDAMCHQPVMNQIMLWIQDCLFSALTHSKILATPFFVHDAI